MIINNVVLISSAQPSANPRAVKEAITLCKYGYTVTFLYVPISPWADTFDLELFKQWPQITWVVCGYHPKNDVLQYYWARFRQKFWLIIFKLFGNVFDAAIKSMVLYSQEIIRKANSYAADLYIGHNLGALPALISASSKYQSKAIFDFEDFHRGEFSMESMQAKRIVQVENYYIPRVNGLTASSQLISDTYSKIFNREVTLIQNVFFKSYALQHFKSIEYKPLKMFWFSQFVGKNRGLEQIFHALNFLPIGSIKFTLLGNIKHDYKKELLEILEFDHTDIITFINPVHEKQIIEIASNHHIGLASEPARDLNNDLALSNKILMYLLAGNAILFSNTKAHIQFISQYPDIGLIYDKTNIRSIEEKLTYLVNNPKNLDVLRMNALNIAKSNLNWDKERLVFIDLINRVLQG